MLSRLLGVVVGLLVACGAPSPPDPPAPAADAPAQPLAEPAQPLAEPDAPPYQYHPPPGVEDRLLAMPSLELFSVDPGHRHDDGFRGYGVLGSVTVHDRAAIQTMIRGLFDNFRPPPELLLPVGVGPAYCFEPRLGVRASDATGTIDLLICYECGRMHVWSPEFREAWILYFGLGRDALRAPLIAAGVPFAPETPTASAGPRVVLKPPAVDGPRDVHDIRRYLRRFHLVARPCFLRDTTIARTVTAQLGFTISQEGVVSAARVQDEIPADGKLARCLADGLKTMRFPAEKRPGDTQVTLPIEFRRD